MTWVWGPAEKEEKYHLALLLRVVSHSKIVLQSQSLPLLQVMRTLGMQNKCRRCVTAIDIDHRTVEAGLFCWRDAVFMCFWGSVAEGEGEAVRSDDSVIFGF